MKKEITYQVFELNKEDQPQFLLWCLNNNLYKTTKDEDFKSRMKMFYEGEIVCDNLTAIVAYDEEKPIGIITCEHNDDFHNAYSLKDGGMGRNGSKISKEYDWGFYHMGMVSFFIKKEYRKNGIAKHMWDILEPLRIDSLKDIPGIHKDSVPLFRALELGFELVKNKAKYSYVTDKESRFTNYKHDIHMLTNGLIEEREQDPNPLYPLRKREKINYNAPKRKRKP